MTDDEYQATIERARALFDGPAPNPDKGNKMKDLRADMANAPMVPFNEPHANDYPDNPLCPRCGGETGWEKEDTVALDTLAGRMWFTERRLKCMTGGCWYAHATLHPFPATLRALYPDNSFINAAAIDALVK